MSGTQGLHDLGINIDLLGRTEQRTACPQCSKRERDKSLGVNIQSGAYHCFRCGWKGRASGAWDFAPIVRVDDPAVAQRKRERLRRTWNESVPLSHSKAHAVRVYLESRALGAVLKKPPTVLRGGPVAGSTKGGSIRLYDPSNGVLGVAEGIESALSLHLLQHIPTWAAFCADNMTRTQLPPGLSKLYIGVDIDMSGKGEQVARALATRVSKRRSGPMVLMVTPEGPAPRDLNDELRQRRAV